VYIDVKVGGFDELERQLLALPGLMADRIMGDGLAAAGRVVRNEARLLVPVDTGALQRSLRTRRRATYVNLPTGRVRVPGSGARTLAGGAGARHAYLVEHGTVKNRPKPYLLPALISTQGRQLGAATSAMRRSFGRIRAGRISSPLARLSAIG